MESAHLVVRSFRAGLARAFTLVEMLVVLSIISIVTLVTLSGHSNFDRSMLLTDAAYNVALSARQMQTFGLSSRSFNVSGSNVTNIAYGVHFDIATPTRYLTFADTQRTTPVNSSICPLTAITDTTSPDYKRGNCIYDASGTADGILETFTFSRGFRVARFCGKSGATTYCSTDSSTPLTALDVVFVRPNTDAIVTAQRGGTSLKLDSAQIYLTTNDAQATRGICVTQIGQISVAQTSCP